KDKAPVESPVESPVGSGGAAPPEAPPRVQQVEERGASKVMNQASNEESGPKATQPSGAGQGVAGQSSQALVRATAQGAARAVVKTPAQTGSKTAPQKNAVATQSVARKTRGWLSRLNANRSISPAAPSGGHSGPSTVLMQASGFKPKSSIGP